MSNAVATTGILVARAPIPDGTAFVTIPELIRVGPPGWSRNKIETSTHNDGTESYILGILRQKDLSFAINYLAGDATHIIVRSDMQNNVKAQWKVTFPSGVIIQGPGRVQTFMPSDAPTDAAQQAEVVVTWAAPLVQS
jgi:hypothetical protein